MLCDVCNKNPATVHLTEIIDNQMNELHLCEECARQKSSQMEQQFGLNDLLAGLMEFEKQTKEKDPLLEALKCPACGLTYTDFRKIGRLGCGDCYTTFKKYLGPLLKKIHGSCMHFGKSPINLEKKPLPKKKSTPNMDELREKLTKAVQDEAFEEAARLRDQIKELEKKEQQNGTDKDKQA
ncbi:MAG: UvrB/UvrC motif-containing protein [Candidatus Omnitrophica bacterium]|nr:UvrB/UvrC motif-containing protein [Candidatus Omnitrophota bacterium]